MQASLSSSLRLVPLVVFALGAACTAQVQGPPGGTVSSAGGATTDTGGASAAGAAGAAGAATAGGQGATTLSLPAPLARRLTRDELAYTLADVLSTAPSDADLAGIPVDRPLEGFVNIATSQTASAEHVAGYSSLARATAAKLTSAFLSQQGGCQSVDAACQAKYVGAVGKLLFRRPLDAQEATDFTALFAAVLGEGGSFEDAARAVVEGLLQAPQFLYRLEHETAASLGLTVGAERNVTGYELASRLSYTVWSSAPDGALLTAAESGALDGPGGVSSQVTRLLQDATRSQRPTARFLLDWAKLESLPDTPLRDELVSSVSAFFADAIWKKGSALIDLFTAPRAFLTPTLAQNYGLSPMGNGLVEYDLSANPARLGLLTQPGLLAGMTNADGGQIVARGLFFQSQIFCGDVYPPPAALADAIASFAASQPPNASLRSIADARSARPECGACHANFDPLAFGLEQFDYQGAFRQVDKLGNTLTTDGWIPGSFTEDGQKAPYTGVTDYMKRLVTLPSVGMCLAKQQLQFAIGRKLEHDYDPVAAALFQSASGSGGTYLATLSAISEHPLFRKMKVEQ